MTKRKTTEQFINDAIAIHGNRYDYSLVNYTGVNNKIKIICNEHGEFPQNPGNHLHGKAGCPNCALKEHFITTKIFIQKAKIVHANKYDYSRTEYKDSKTKVRIICPEHNDFFQTPNSHLTGYGCYDCSVTTADVFIKKATKIHNYKYDYTQINYIDAKTKVKIICPKHKAFFQIPNSHLQGKGCRKCANAGTSKPEQKWLDNFNIKEEYRQYRILNFKVDGFDPETNTVYEFHGDFWHGNPKRFNLTDINPVSKKTYGELYENTLQRDEKIRDAGYNLITIWESDFKSF